jgi:hypothetical protein
MGFQTKVQLINRTSSEQWYIKGEVVEWFIEDKSLLALRRLEPPPSVLKKKHRTASSRKSNNSSRKRRAPSRKAGSSKGPKP